MRRWLPVLAPLAVLALLAGLLYGLGTGQRGATLLAGLLERFEPRLTLEHRAGNLAAARFARISWRDGEIEVTLREVEWQLDAGCLTSRRLCVERLRIGALEIQTGTTPGEGGALELAPIELPFALELADARIDTLVILAGDAELLRLGEIALVGSMTRSTAAFSTLTARREALGATLAGRIELRDELPMNLSGRLQDGESVDARIAVRGDLARLDLDVANEGRYALDATGWVEPLAEPLAFAMQASNRAPLALAADGDGEILLGKGTLQAGGSLERIELGLDAPLDSPTLGSNTVRLSGAWSEQQLQIETLAIDGAIGHAEAHGTLGTDAELALDLQATMRDACAPGWAPQLECRVSGTARITGTLGGEAPRFSLETALSGTANDYPVALDARVHRLGEAHWRIEQALLASGANRVQLAGEYGERIELAGTLAIEDLSQTLRSARGKGGGTLRVSGTPEAPGLDARLRFENLAWEGTRAARLEIDATLADPRATNNRLSVRARDAHAGGIDIGQATLELDGSAAEHVLALDAGSAAGALDMRCNGAWSDSAGWSARCARFTLETGEDEERWTPDRALELAWRRDDATFSLAPFCLQGATAAVCSEQVAEFGADAFSGVELRANAVPVALLRNWLPPDLEASGTFDLGVSARRTAGASPRIEGRLGTSALSLAPLAAGTPLPLAITDLSATLSSAEDKARLDWEFTIGAEGRCTGAITLGDPGGANSLAGRIALEAIDIAPVARIVPGVEDAAGRVDGEINLGGTLGAPHLAGRVQLRDGRLGHEQLPAPIDDFSVEVDFDGTDALVAGRFTTRAGSGRVDGTLALREQHWSADLRLRAERLLFEPLPGSTLTLAPDIRIALGPSLAEVSGEVRIPHADIRLDRLPETAVSVSPDTVIVGEAPPGQAFDYRLAVKVSLGENVRFQGLGAEARLAGGIEVLRQPGDAFEGRGEIRIAEGRYKAYGQDLEVKEGLLIFRGPLARPDLRISAERPLEDESVRVGVRVRGNARAPTVKVFSVPSMEENRALFYLLTGRAPEEDTDLDLAVASAMLKLGLSVTGANRVTGGIMQQFGIQDFAIDARQVEGGTEVRLSGYLTPDIYFRYGVSTFEQVNTFRLRYRLTRKVFVEAVSGVENAVDLLYSFER